jgi:hypothetical protein
MGFLEGIRELHEDDDDQGDAIEDGGVGVGTYLSADHSFCSKLKFAPLPFLSIAFLFPGTDVTFG